MLPDGFQAAMPLGLGEDNEVVIKVADPDLATPGIGIDVDAGDDARTRGADAADGRVELSRFEPESDAVTHWLAGIPDRAVMMPGLQPVQLHDELPIDEQLLIFRAAVAAGGGQHPLVPLACFPDIRDGDHRLRPHGRDSFLGHGPRLGVTPAGWLAQFGPGAGSYSRSLRVRALRLVLQGRVAIRPPVAHVELRRPVPTGQ